MTVGEMLGGGARLMREHPRALALWALLYLAAAAAMMALTWPMMGEMAAFQRAVLAAQAAGAPPPAAPDGFFGATLFVNLLVLVSLAAIFAAVVRAAAWGGEDRYGFLRLGMDEARLVGLGAVLGLIGMAAFLVLGLAAMLIVGAFYALFGPGGMAVMVPLWLAIAAAAIWAQVRISLAGALTVLHGRIVLRGAWRATRGRFWPLFAAYLAISLAYMVATLIVAAIFFPDVLGVYAALLRGDPGPAAMPIGIFERTLGVRTLAGMAVGTVVYTAIIGWFFGAVATAAMALDEAHLQATEA